MEQEGVTAQDDVVVVVHDGVVLLVHEGVVFVVQEGVVLVVQEGVVLVVQEGVLAQKDRDAGRTRAQEAAGRHMLSSEVGRQTL
jgi:hypothetical protein